MKKYIIFLTLIVLCQVQSFSAEVNYSPAVRDLLQQLDSVLTHKDDYIKKIEGEIQFLKEKQKNKTLSDEQRFKNNKVIYDLLCVFNADSAMNYVNENIAISLRLHRQDWLKEWTINKSFILAATGLLKESYDILNTVSPDGLNRELRMKYYTQAAYLYSHMGAYLVEDSHLRNEYYSKESMYNDSLSMLCRPQDELYLWYRGWKFRDNPQMRTQIIQQLKQKLAKAAFNNRVDAMNAYVLANLCKDSGDNEAYLKYLIYSGMADIRSANKDVASLEELAKILFKLGDLDHAYSYISFCQQNALYYRNRVRVVSIANVQNAIWDAYQQRNLKQESYLRTYTIVVTILSVILIVAVFYIYTQLKRLALSRKKLKAAKELQDRQMQEIETVHKIQVKANAKLKELNEQLQEANSNLKEANYIKVEYISHIFIFCSNYISKLNEYRKTINRKIKTGQYADIKLLTDSKTMVQDELKEFYQNFDMIFLNLYPDFIKDFNALLKPEAQYKPKTPGTLNTQLRIYALVRLGINDSVKIAEFLHCSPQTIYNNRLMVRSNAIIPKENFAYTISHLGSVQL